MMKQTKPQQNKGQLFFVLPFSVLLIVINIVRILTIPITIDETGYRANEGYIDLFFKSYASANNHILHSVFRKFFVEACGDSLFFLRVDSLLAQITFVVFSYQLCKRLFKEWYWVLCGFVIMNLVSPFVFDFWGLSRGYALGIALMTVSIYYLVRYISDRRLQHLSISVIAGCLCIYSNFSFLNYYAALLGAVLLQRVLFYKTNTVPFSKEVWVLLIPSVIIGLLITEPLIILHHGGELSFLGANGFKNDTVTSLVKCSVFEMADTFKSATIIRITYYGTLLLSVFWVYVLVRPAVFSEYGKEVRIGVALHSLLLLPAAALVLQFHLLGINYLIDRAAIFFIILYIVQLIYWLYFLQLTIFRQSRAVLVVVMLLVSYNFFSRLDMHRAFLWWFDETDMVVLQRMNKETIGKPGKVRVWADWQFVPSFTYDMVKYYPGKFDLIDSSRTLPEGDSSFDYIYKRIDDQRHVPVVYVEDTTVCGGAFKLYKKR